MRVLVFGDSITQGFWDTEGGWAARLRKHYDQRQLKDLKNNDEPVVFNLGISGDITEGVLKRFEPELEARRWRWPQEEFSFVFAIGINDTASDSGIERSDTEKYRTQLEQLIDLGSQSSSRIMFIGLTPCVEEIVNQRAGEKVLSNQRIKSFDMVLAEVCEAKKVAFVPLFSKLQKELDDGRRLFDDGLHPNNEGHQLIFEMVQPELDKLLSSN